MKRAQKKSVRDMKKMKAKKTPKNPLFSPESIKLMAHLLHSGIRARSTQIRGIIIGVLL